MSHLGDSTESASGVQVGKIWIVLKHVSWHLWDRAKHPLTRHVAVVPNQAVLRIGELVKQRLEVFLLDLDVFHHAISHLA